MADILRHQCESERAKVTVESEDVLDIPLVRETTGRVIHNGNLLVGVFELFTRSLEGSSPD